MQIVFLVSNIQLGKPISIVDNEVENKRIQKGLSMNKQTQKKYNRDWLIKQLAKNTWPDLLFNTKTLKYTKWLCIFWKNYLKKS